MNFEDMPYEPPEWLRAAIGHIAALPGYAFEGDMDAKGFDWSVETDRVVGEYFGAYLQDPVAARRDMRVYLDRFGPVNDQANILNKVLPDQFGMIANIATMGYGDMNKTGRREVLAVINDILSYKNSANIPGFIRPLRDATLVRDLVLHWSAVNWPPSYEHQDFMSGSEWPAVQAQLESPANNPLLFALAAPLHSTAPVVRQRFAAEYPKLSGQGLDIIAAHLFCAGAHDEILSDMMPELYGSWGAGVDKRLQDYAEEYRQPLLERIAGTNWRKLLLSRDFSFDELYDKMRKTRFDLSVDGTLVRRSEAGHG